METGSTALAFANEQFVSTSGCVRPNRSNDLAAVVEFAFVAPIVLEAFRRARDSGATSIQEPEIKLWGQVVSYVRDLNGVLIEIGSELGQI